MLLLCRPQQQRLEPLFGPHCLATVLELNNIKKGEKGRKREKRKKRKKRP
jgi:hypothetical protein